VSAGRGREEDEGPGRQGDVTRAPAEENRKGGRAKYIKNGKHNCKFSEMCNFAKYNIIKK
jgi:hypothetical protein